MIYQIKSVSLASQVIICSAAPESEGMCFLSSKVIHLN
jgi:hypothetical protein